MKYKPGDSVWARSPGPCSLAPLAPAAGERAGVIFCYRHTGRFGEIYSVDVQGCPSGGDASDRWLIAEPWLRPRKDDYQQHEGLGSWDEIRNPTKLLEHEPA